jgi:predicted ATPase/transcriptional regulator with XRE-family HTH domain/Tfp pilus assembly protein PilF
MADETTFGSWLKQRRKELGLAQEELAEHIGCSESMLRKLESGERHPSGQVAQLLAGYLHVPEEERQAFIAFARSGKTDPTATLNSSAPWRASGVPAVPAPPKNNLPSMLTGLIGREKEEARIVGLLHDHQVRLLTLTGAPGIGKTRLALQVATRLASQALRHFGDGVFFVQLATLQDPALVVPTIAQTLGLQEAGGQPVEEVLVDFLRDRKRLLLLDNLEQILDSAPAIVKLLERCAGLKVLATSREALHVRGEHRFRVQPLDLPDLSLFPSAAEQIPQSPNHYPQSLISDLSSCASVELFVERAQAVSPDFTLSMENAEDIAEVCIRLEGLPLAIELAAARVDHLSLRDIRTALNSRLKLLTGGARDLPLRQRTLRSAIEWSYGLMSDAEQKVFRRLSVFSGGSTSEAAEAVCNAPRDLDASIADVLTALVDKNLLRAQRVAEHVDGGYADGLPEKLRFGMLETIREYASEKLWASWGASKGAGVRVEEGEEGEVTAKAHALYFMKLAEEAAPKMRGAEQLEWFSRIEAEHHNFRAALRWAREKTSHTSLFNSHALTRQNQEAEPGEVVYIGLHTAVSLAYFWYVRGYFSEGREELIAVLAAVSAFSTSHPSSPLLPSMQLDRARALNIAGVLANEQSDYASARSLFEEGLPIAREIGDAELIARILNNLAVTAHDQSDYAAAQDLWEESLSLARKIGQKEQIAIMLTNLGLIACRRGKYDAARALHEQSLEISRETGNQRGVALALNNLGEVAYCQVDYGAARAFHEESLSIQQKINNRWGIAASLVNLGLVAFMQGDYASAASLYRQSLAEGREIGHKATTAESLHNLGLVALAQGDYANARASFEEGLTIQSQIGDKIGLAANLLSVAGAITESGEAERGARLLGAASALFDRLGVMLRPEQRLLYERAAYLARAQLGETNFAKSVAEGRAMTAEEAVAYALASTD